ncbi:OLC1v1029641C5 [Oldenlandia corymbosa var. corymbosa]|uniref:OLC1v1029641C5 n=1 Tax=Oldenlandia corymbosa var. corymbosa TaxID=529605 RepID=A0AAV1CHN7_OLDCO|nr:OLC1v1029641C5 [Oldenlandia corymbosa var. corymbosa]
MFDVQVDVIRVALIAGEFKGVKNLHSETGYMGGNNEVGQSLEITKVYTTNLISDLKNIHSNKKAFNAIRRLTFALFMFNK